MGAPFDFYWDSLAKWQQRDILEVLECTEEELVKANNFQITPLVEDVYIGSPGEYTESLQEAQGDGTGPDGPRGPINPEGPTTPEGVADNIKDSEMSPVEIDTLELFINAASQTEREYLTKDADSVGDVDDYSYYMGMLDAMDFFEVVIANAKNTDLDKDSYLEGILEKLLEVI